LRFLAVSIAALALALTALALQAPVPKKQTATSVGAKAKTVPHVAASAKTGAAKTGTAKSLASKSRASKTGVSKSVASKSVASKSGSKTGAKSRRAAVARRPPTQQQPTTDRYKEIQQALADKGYFQGPVDGVWNAGSVEALKRFQKDQNLDPDGKIGSLSLIALGLGPKRAVASVQSTPTSSDPVDPPPVAQPQP
jgi:peptidoglycan hydrolase-like protein with peptidoglycan-binding domain